MYYFTISRHHTIGWLVLEILVLNGGYIPPAPAVPANTRISVRLKCVQEHSSPPGSTLPLPTQALGRPPNKILLWLRQMRAGKMPSAEKMDHATKDYSGANRQHAAPPPRNNFTSS